MVMDIELLAMTLDPDTQVAEVQVQERHLPLTMSALQRLLRRPRQGAEHDEPASKAARFESVD